MVELLEGQSSVLRLIHGTQDSDRNFDSNLNGNPERWEGVIVVVSMRFDDYVPTGDETIQMLVNVLKEEIPKIQASGLTFYGVKVIYAYSRSL
ncbi:hypothetical protein SCUP234_10380 [Seiridium cupressi]